MGGQTDKQCKQIEQVLLNAIFLLSMDQSLPNPVQPDGRTGGGGQSWRGNTVIFCFPQQHWRLGREVVNHAHSTARQLW